MVMSDYEILFVTEIRLLIKSEKNYQNPYADDLSDLRLRSNFKSSRVSCYFIVIKN
jgi:hypothetical protein